MQAVKPKRLEPLTQASPSKVFAKPGSLQTYLPHHAAPQQPPTPAPLWADRLQSGDVRGGRTQGGPLSFGGPAACPNRTLSTARTGS